jgi:hypothetical protein
MRGVKTQADVRLELIEMEKALLPASGTSNQASATSLLTAAFNIEDAQYVVFTVSVHGVHFMLGQVRSPDQSCRTG